MWALVLGVVCGFLNGLSFGLDGWGSLVCWPVVLLFLFIVVWRLERMYRKAVYIYIYIYILKSKEQLSWTIKEFLVILLSRMSDNKYIYSKLNFDHRSMSGLGNFNGPFGLKGEGEKVKGNRVELAKNRLILSKFYFTLLPLNPNGP